MTVRGGGIPRRPLALTPNGRMGPPLRSFAADAHGCIMVRVLGPTGYKVVARLIRARKRARTIVSEYGWQWMEDYMANKPSSVKGHLDVAQAVDQGKSAASFDTQSPS